MPNPGDRLLALDAFRGITVAGMVLVNNPGTWEYVYGPLRHARWHGWTPTDLVFPFSSSSSGSPWISRWDAGAAQGPTGAGFTFGSCDGPCCSSRSECC